MRQQLDITPAPLGDVPGVALAGEVDIAVAKQVEAAIDDGIRASAGAFVVDLCDVDFLDSTGVTLLMRARALLGREGVVLLSGTFVLWAVEAAVYLPVARSVELDFSVTGALYLVALTNFVAALPAAPGSIGTFDAAVAFGARRLGASGSMAVTYMLLLRFVLYIPITVVGLVILVTRYGGWSRLRTAVRLGAEAEAEATRA